MFWWIVCFFSRTLLLCRTMCSNVNKARTQKLYSILISSINLLISGISFAGTQDSWGAKGPSLILSFPPIHEHSNNYFQFCIWDSYLLFLTTAHVVARPLLNNNYQALEISIWLNVNSMFLFDFIWDLITAIFLREVRDLNSDQLLSFN